MSFKGPILYFAPRPLISGDGPAKWLDTDLNMLVLRCIWARRDINKVHNVCGFPQIWEQKLSKLYHSKKSYY
jgi:hypothetical protein